MSPHARAIVKALALLVLAYPSSYLVLSYPVQCAKGGGGVCTTWTEPNYLVGGDAAEVVFRPLEQFDRELRPGFWATRSYPNRGYAIPKPADTSAQD
jgi:hypothetical protein